MPTPDFDLEYGAEDDEDIITDDYLTANKDAVCFLIDCSPSMQEHDEDGNSPLKSALQCALNFFKRKVISSSSDLVGIMLFNTEKEGWMNNHFHFLQSIDEIDAKRIQELYGILENGYENDPDFTPLTDKNSVVPFHTICRRIQMNFSEKAKTADAKRIFLITDNDNPIPHSIDIDNRYTMPAFHKAKDLAEAKIFIQPFFIHKPGAIFDYDHFYKAFLYHHLSPDEDLDQGKFNASVNFEALEDSVRSREALKRSQFSIPMHIAPGLSIGVKGYILVLEQKKGSYRWVSMKQQYAQVVDVKTLWTAKKPSTVGNELPSSQDPEEAKFAPEDQLVLKPKDIQYYFDFGGKKVIFTKDELATLRMYDEPGITILGFKDASAIKIQWNLTKPWFIYPSEKEYIGSNRTFTALLMRLHEKQKVAIARFVRRRNAYPIFVAIFPQLEELDDEGMQVKPPGMHLVQLPYADDRRQNPLKDKATGRFFPFVAANGEQIDAAKTIVERLHIKSGFRPGRYPNPSLQWHYKVLEDTALDREIPEMAEDNTMPNYEAIDKRVGPLISTWKTKINTQIHSLPPTLVAGVKKEIPVTGDEDMKIAAKTHLVETFTVPILKAWLKRHNMDIEGRKSVLVDRIYDHFSKADEN